MSRSPSPRTASRTVAALVVPALLAAGCSSDRRAISRDDLPEVPDEPTHVVVLDDDGFDVDELDVTTEDLVEFRIEGDDDHGIRADVRIDTGLLLPGEATLVVFDEPGRYEVVDVTDEDQVLVVTSVEATEDAAPAAVGTPPTPGPPPPGDLATGTPTPGTPTPGTPATGVASAGTSPPDPTSADPAATGSAPSRSTASGATVDGAPVPQPDPAPPGPTSTGPTSTGPTATGPVTVAADGGVPAGDRGMALWAWTADGYGLPSAVSALASMAELGVDHVQLAPRWFLDDARDDAPSVDPDRTATAASLATAVTAARALGLGVTVKPMLDVEDGSWRGALDPADPDRFFATYGDLVVDLARRSQALGVDRFVVGVELASLSGDRARWRSLVARVRTAFTGTVTYAALPYEAPAVGFWDVLDEVGVNAWSPLADGPTTDVGALRTAWEAELDRYEAVGRAAGLPVVVLEAGFTSQRGTATEPWRWDLSDVHAPDEQAAGYAALLAAVADEGSWLRGLHWWAWRQTDRGLALDFTPQGAPAADVLRASWR